MAAKHDIIQAMQKSIKHLISKIAEIMGGQPSFMLYGSAVCGDFRAGWSDIDFICLTAKIKDSQAAILLNLRQELAAQNLDNPYFNLFEGVFLSESTLTGLTDDNIVYWGTSGQKIIRDYTPDAFARISILDYGQLMCGKDFRSLLNYPTKAQVLEAIKNHLAAIRQHGAKTGESLYSAGWMLDIARCLYTLKYGEVASKTEAGEWALRENLCGTPEVLERVLKIRRNPLDFDKSAGRGWLSSLDLYVQKFTNVLEKEINEIEKQIGEMWSKAPAYV